MKSILKKIIERFGYEITNKSVLASHKSSDIPSPASCDSRLKHIATLGYRPDVIYDCGAFIGKWARVTNKVFPEASFILVEPNHGLYEQIRANIEGFKDKVTLIKGAVADSEGEVILNIWENSRHSSRTTALAGSSILGHVQGEASEKLTVPKRTIDNIMKETGLKPGLIKMDLQGAELPALHGAQEALKHAELVITEFGCLDAYENRTTSQQLMDLLYDNNYILYDIVDLRYRPFDGALTGGDFFFLKKDSPLREHKDYF